MLWLTDSLTEDARIRIKTRYFVSIQLSIFLIYFSYKLNIYFFHHIIIKIAVFWEEIYEA